MSPSSNSPRRGQLIVVARNSLTEIRVYDAEFKPVEFSADNLGEIQLELTEGIYEVAFRDGSSWQKSGPVLLLNEQQVQVRQDQVGAASESVSVKTDGWKTLTAAVQVVEAPRLVKSEQSATSSAPREGVRRPRTRSELLTPEGKGVSAFAVYSSWENLLDFDVPGFSLIVMHPVATVPLEFRAINSDNANVTPQVRQHPDGVTAAFTLPPGPCVLVVRRGEFQLALPLYSAPGWRTQVICPGNSLSDFARSVVRLAPETFTGEIDPEESRDMARTEGNALELLGQSRPLRESKLRDLIRQLISRKSFNPMLGLYAAHLLAKQSSTGRRAGAGVNRADATQDSDGIQLLDSLLIHLEELFYRGPNRDLPQAALPNADLQAIRVLLARLRDELLTGISISHPPLLRKGWEIIREASVISPEIIPAESLISTLGGNLWGPSHWTIWKWDPREIPPPSLANSDPFGMEVCVVSNALRGVAKQHPADFSVVGDAPLRESTSETTLTEFSDAPASVRTQPSSPASIEHALDQQILIVRAAMQVREMREWFRAGCSSLSNAERAVASAIAPIADQESEQQRFDRLSLSLSGRETPGESTTSWTLKRLTTATNCSARTAERALSSLVARYLEQADFLNLNLLERAVMARPETIIPYDPNFLGDGFNVAHPSLESRVQADSLADGMVLDYTHFSLVMHARRRVAVYTAHNVDAAQQVRVPGGLTWRMDERAGEYQLGPEMYADNQLDRGHLVRRADVLWGSVAEARAANKSTFFYTNAAPQHQNFNQDEWLSLEDWVLTDATDFSYRLCVFTGPVLRDNDPVLSDLPSHLRTAFRARGQAQIPAAFWKIVVLRDESAGGDDLSAIAFAMKQSEMWNDKEGSRLLNLRVHQVTIAAIEGWTGLNFGELRDVDELEWSESRIRAAAEAPPWPAVHSASDIVRSGLSRRARGIRARRLKPGPLAPVRTSRTAASVKASGEGCGCQDTSFNAAEAIAALGRDLAALTDQVAGQSAPEAGVTAPTREGGTPRIHARGRSLPEAADPTGSDLGEVAESRVRSVLDRTPSAMKARVEPALREIVRQAEVYRGNLPPVRGPATRIVGGDRVPAGGFPSCCCIGDATSWFCSGVVVAPQVVLTAAHCTASIRRVLVGRNEVNGSGGRVITVRRAVVHSGWRDYPYYENDINVLILDAPATVTPTPIASLEDLRNASETWLVGFGYNDPNRPVGFGTKRQVAVPVLPIPVGSVDDLGDLPQELGFHTGYEFVAGRKGLGRDSCNGDSGGPAYLQVNGDFVLAGLTSRATLNVRDNCGDGGIYVRPDQFVEWIRDAARAAGVSIPF